MSSLKRNVIYNSVYQFLILFLPFITAPYLSRVVGPDGIGLFSYSYSIALYFTLFALLGLNNYGNREIASVQNDPVKRSRLFFEIYITQISSFTVCLVIYLLYAFNFAYDKKAAVIQSIFVLSSLLDVNWFFFGMEKFKITVLRNTVIKLITMLLIFVLVKNSDDLYIYITVMASGYLVSQLSLWPFLKKYVHFTSITFHGVIRHIRPNLVLFIPVISVSVYKIMDKVMLGHLGTMEELGFFDNAEKIINVPIALITAIGTVMMPRMTNLIASNKIKESRVYIDKTMLIMLFFATGAMMGIVAISDVLSITYYGNDFQSSGVVMNYLAITILFLACGNVIRSQYLIPNRKDSVYITSAILGAISNFIVNLLLIPRLGAIGAAIGTVVAEFIVCFYQLYSVRKLFNFSKYFIHEMAFLLVGIVMYVSIKYVPTPPNEIIRLFILGIVGIAVYGILAGGYLLIVKKISLSSLFSKSTST